MDTDPVMAINSDEIEFELTDGRMQEALAKKKGLILTEDGSTVLRPNKKQRTNGDLQSPNGKAAGHAKTDQTPKTKNAKTKAPKSTNTKPKPRNRRQLPFADMMANDKAKTSQEHESESE